MRQCPLRVHKVCLRVPNLALAKNLSLRRFERKTNHKKCPAEGSFRRAFPYNLEPWMSSSASNL